MAKMIPPQVGPQTPDSERRVFELLRSDPDTRDWIVYHSLGFSSAYSGMYGEVDFVALIPRVGVLCIEVKGGGVRCKDGLWTTTDREGQIHAYSRSPFQQAREGMFKLLKAVKQHFGETSQPARCPFGWAVILVDSLAPPPSPEFVRSELLDRTDLASGFGTRLSAVPSLAQVAQWYGPPSSAALLALAKFFRPDFDRIAAASTGLWDAEKRIIALTEEQYGVLDLITDNEFALVHGGAGTGKTMLALELAKRIAAGNRSVLVICFNRELGLWLSERVKSLGPATVVAGHLHKLLRERLSGSPFDVPTGGANFDDSWYELAALQIADGREHFDAILVDEAQDFPADLLLNVLENWLTPNKSTPRICLFGDFTKQALYESPAGSRETIRKRLGTANFPLSQNCRNARKIAFETELLTGSFEIRQSEKQPEGFPVARVFFDTADDQRKSVDRALQQLRTEGFAASDIVILGTRRRENSCLSGADALGGFRIIERSERANSAGVVYSTIHAFKGLESPAVILLDCDLGSGAASEALLYVGMTRARTRLTMVLPESCREELARREKANFKIRID